MNFRAFLRLEGENNQGDRPAEIYFSVDRERQDAPPEHIIMGIQTGLEPEQ